MIDWQEEERVARERARKMPRMDPAEVTVEWWLSAHHLLFPDSRGVRTRRSELGLMRGLREKHGSVTVRGFTPMMAQQWTLAHPGSKGRAVLRRAWRRAVLMGVAEVNVWRLVDVPRRLKEPVRAPSDAELALIVGDCEARGGWYSGVFERMILLAAYTGAREGGLLALRWDDVDLEGRRMEVTEKGAKTRRVALPTQAVRALEEVGAFEWEWCECRLCLVDGGRCASCGKRQRKGGRVPPWVRPFVFRGAAGGRLDPSRLRESWRAVRGEFPHGFHSLRHYAATWMAAQGADALDIAMQLGHVDKAGRPYVRMLQRVYDHPDPDAALARILEVTG